MSFETKDMPRNVFLFCFIYTCSDVIRSGSVSRIVTDNSGTVCDSFEMAKSAPVTAPYQCVCVYTVIPAIL